LKNKQKYKTDRINDESLERKMLNSKSKADLNRKTIQNNLKSENFTAEKLQMHSKSSLSPKSKGTYSSFHDSDSLDFALEARKKALSILQKQK